jgi:hypothetical protein
MAGAVALVATLVVISEPGPTRAHTGGPGRGRGAGCRRAACPVRRGTGARHRRPGRGAAVRGSRGGPSSPTPPPREPSRRARRSSDDPSPSACTSSSGLGNRSARIHTSCAVVVAPTLDRALARWCLTVECDRPSRWAAAFSDPAAMTAATTPTSRSVARSAAWRDRRRASCSRSAKRGHLPWPSKSHGWAGRRRLLLLRHHMYDLLEIGAGGGQRSRQRS